MNILAFDAEWKENERKMRIDMKNDAIEMLEAAGVKNVQGHDGDGTMGRGIHEMGTARMGLDPKTSVLNKWNQVWDAAKRICNRWIFYGFFQLCKSITHLYGHDCKSCRSCRE